MPGEAWYIIKLKDGEEFLITAEQYKSIKTISAMPRATRPDLINIGDDESVALNYIASIKRDKNLGG